MRIGLDATAMAGKGGNATYTRELAQHLIQIAEDSFYGYGYLHELFSASDRRLDSVRWKRRPVFVSPPYVPERLANKVNDTVLDVFSRIDGLDLFHFTNPLAYQVGPFRTVVTIHDLAPLHDPQWAKENTRQALAERLPEIVKSASGIIAVSDFTKCDFLERFPIRPEKITVIQEAAGRAFYPQKNVDAVRNALHTDRYFLYAGQLQPRKNVLNLIKGFAAFSRENPDPVLVLVGAARDVEYSRSVDETIRREGVENRVIRLGYVDDEMLRALYSSALAFVYPSFFEGFGLPIAEALACGTPVITSNTSSLPEVAGDAGILVDPVNPDEIADALSRLGGDGSFRTILQGRALKRARSFSWEKTAEETLAVYRYIMGNP